MRRVLIIGVPVVTLVLAGLVAAHYQTSSTGQKPPSDPQKGEKHVFRLDAEQLIKEYDKNKDGALQRDEVPSYVLANFDKLDANKDGKLTREELEIGAAHFQPKRQASDVVLILIEMSDCDECCAEELQRIYDVIRKLDKNNTGKIDPAALKTVRQELVNERVDSIFKELDTNKDGKLSNGEARGMIKANFEKLDANKDGFVDRAELLQAASERAFTKKDNQEK